MAEPRTRQIMEVVLHLPASELEKLVFAMSRSNLESSLPGNRPHESGGPHHVENKDAGSIHTFEG